MRGLPKWNRDFPPAKFIVRKYLKSGTSDKIYGYYYTRAEAIVACGQLEKRDCGSKYTPVDLRGSDWRDL